MFGVINGFAVSRKWDLTEETNLIGITLARILEALFYSDIVPVSSRRRWTYREKELLTENCLKPPRYELSGSRFKPRYLTYLYQPNEPATNLLQINKHSLVITMIEEACDFITRTKEEALALRNVIREYAVIKWRRKDKVQDCLNSFYSGSRYTKNREWRRNKNFGGYADKLSKVNNMPCAHVQFRIQAPETIRRLGIREPKDFLTFNREAFFRERLRLFVVDYGKLGLIESNNITGRKRREVTEEDVERGIKQFQRLGLGKDGFAVQAFVDARANKRDYLKEVKLDWNAFSNLRSNKQKRLLRAFIRPMISESC
jgi:hypothetical protein